MFRRAWCGFALAAAYFLSVPAAGASGHDEAAAAFAAAPSAAELSAPAAFDAPSLSPDGRHVAAIATADGESRILIFESAAPQGEARPIGFGEGERVEWLRWAGSGRLLLGLHVEQARATELVALDLASGRIRRLAADTPEARGDNVIHLDPAGRFALLSAQGKDEEFPSVYRIDLATGAAARVVRPEAGVLDWYADPAGVVRAGVGSKDGRRWLLYRAGDDEGFRRVMGGSARERDVDQLVPLAGSDQGYAIAGADDGRYALFRYDFASGRLGALVYENPAVDLDGFQTSPDGALLGVVFTDDRERTRWFDAGLARDQALVDAALPGAVNRIVSMDRVRARLLVASATASDPGRYYLFDAASGELTPMADPYPALHLKRLATVESVRYRARDGLEIQAYLTLPAGRAAAGLPLVVMPHGGPFVRDSWNYDAWVQYLAARGYAVLQPNYRGSTGFGREFTEAGDGQWGRGMQDDVDDGVKWLAARGVADSGRVCIMGASYGGYAAMWAAARDKGIYRCAISFAGISDVAGQLEFDRTTFPSPRAFRAWRSRIQGRDGSSLADLSPLTYADRMTMPLLIAHGTADATVPLAQSQKLHEALEKHGRAHDYVVYPGEDHGLADPDNSIDFLDRVGAFLDRYNPA